MTATTLAAFRGTYRGKRKHPPQEETTRSAYWQIELGNTQYWAITFDKTTAEYTARRYGEEPGGDGEKLHENLTGDEAWHVAMTYGVYWSK